MSLPRYIHNISGTTQTYRGVPITAGSFQLIDPANLGWYQQDDLFITDIGNSVIRMSADGSTDYSTSTAANLAFLLGSTPNPTDTDGTPLARAKITRAGWHYQDDVIEWITSLKDSEFNSDKNGNDLGSVTLQFYDSNDTELTDQVAISANCVKTRVTWEPGYNLEIIGGSLHQAGVPTSDIRLWVTAVPDLTVVQGGSVPFVQGGLNIKYLGMGKIHTMDGRTPKFMNYDTTYHSNKFEIICKHSAGVQHPIMLIIQLFRENT